MKLHGLFFFVSSVFAVGVFAACSDAGSGGGANPDAGSVASDASTSSSSSSSMDGGGKVVGNQNMDAGNNGNAKDAGGGPTDSGAVIGSCKKVNDGTYTVVQTGTRVSDADASATYQFLCSDNTSTTTYPQGAQDLTGCTVMVSGDGCTTTYDCNIDKNGYTEIIKGTQVVNADGNGYTTNFTMQWTNDGTGDIALDCTYNEVGTRQ